MTIPPLAIAAAFLIAAAPAVRDAGTIGAVYPVAEPDALAELEAAAAAVDWKTVLRKAVRESFKNYVPPDPADLPRARTGDGFLFDPAYTLDHDVQVGEGMVYPAGFSYNPLDYVSLPGRIVVLDAADGEQVDWLTDSDLLEDFRTTILITGGDAQTLAAKLKRPVHYMTGRLAQRLGLRAVPSVVEQEGRFFRVREIDVELENSSD
ncbi:MAG: hypothetical protein ACNS63_04320 [Candidatus Nitrospinota bacterium M3_3B_026]